MCAFSALEAALRFSPFRFTDSFYQRDLLLGWKLRPGSDGWYVDEGESHVTINSHGMRDHERAQNKAPGTVRVALLGDSFTEAMQVDLDKTFGAVMERRLNGCAAFSGRKPEVLNFGVSHYGTAQELLVLEEKVWEFDPDWVILAFFSGNDVYNNHPDLNPVNAAITPYFRLSGGRLERMLESDSAWKRAAIRVRDAVGRAANHSRVVGVAAEAYMRFARSSGINREAESRFGSDYADRLVYLEPDGAMKAAWEATEAILAEMAARVRERNRRFLLVSLSTAIQVHPSAERREEFRRHVGAASLWYADDRLAAFSARQAIPFLALARPMLAEAEKTGEYLHGFRNGRAAAMGVGHWNERGHEKAGELIAERICGMAGSR